MSKTLPDLGARMRKITRKGSSQMGIEKIAIIVICILVLIAAVLYISRSKLLDWIRNMPGYKYDETDKVITPGSDEIAKFQGCNPKTGVIDHEIVWVCTDTSKCDKTLVNTGLDWPIGGEIGSVDSGGIIRITDATTKAKYPNLHLSYKFKDTNVLCRVSANN
jgi:hypothetical protein